MTDISVLPSNGYLSTVTAALPQPSWIGTRGNTWEKCNDWYETMPGSLFQLTCFFLCLAFMSGGSSVVGVIYNHVLCGAAFLVFTMLGVIDTCSLDMIVWGILLALINIGQIIYVTIRSRAVEKILEGDMYVIYHKRFAPFGVSPETFVELVSCKGCQIMKLEKGQKYSAENKTPIDRVSMLISGKLNVTSNNEYLHSVSENDFVDSPEWESVKKVNAGTTYKVTITAEVESRYIAWKRKPLLLLLGKQKNLSKLFDFMIGHDLVKKLYCLNTRHFNERGFHYDIRLPCVLSLKEDVMEREKKRQAVGSPPGTPAGRRHKKLGKKANEHYSKLFSRRMSEKINMLKDRKEAQTTQQKP